MGISTTYYTVYGVSIPYDNEMSDLLYEADLYKEFEDEGPCSIITDGMSGKYMVIGKILFDGGDLRWGDYKDTWAEISVSKDVLSMHKTLATEKFLKHFPDGKKYLKGPWKLITFMHAS